MTPWREWTGSPLGLSLLSAVAVALGLAVAVQFSPAPRKRSSGMERSRLEQEAATAKRNYQRAWSGVRAVQMRDSLRALARPGLTVLLDPRLAREGTALLEERVRAAWTPFGVTKPRIPVLIALSATTKRSAAQPFDDPIFTALPTAAGEPCIMLFRVPGSWRRVERDARMLRQNMFGCALLAQHGYPGVGVQDELRRIAWSPSMLRFDRYYWQFSRTSNTLGAVGPWASPEVLAFLACSAGQHDGCVTLAKRPAPRTRDLPPGMSRSVRLFSDFSLLAFLRASLPPADFERLWRDDRPFAVAVAEITGTPLEVWVRRALLRNGQALTSAASSTSPIAGRALLFLLIAVVTVTAAQTRRTVS